MLANPIVVPAYANLVVWGMAMISILVEIRTALFLLRRMKRNVIGFGVPLFVINMVTWLPFLVVLDRLPRMSDTMWVVTVAALEALIVVIEGRLILAATRGQFFCRNLPCRAIRPGQAMYVSLTANLVSIVAMAVALAGVEFVLEVVLG